MNRLLGSDREDTLVLATALSRSGSERSGMYDFVLFFSPNDLHWGAPSRNKLAS